MSCSFLTVASKIALYELFMNATYNLLSFKRRHYPHAVALEFCFVLCRTTFYLFIYYKQQRANRPLTCCNIEQCIHDTMFELSDILADNHYSAIY